MPRNVIRKSESRYNDDRQNLWIRYRQLIMGIDMQALSRVKRVGRKHGEETCDTDKLMEL